MSDPLDIEAEAVKLLSMARELSAQVDTVTAERNTAQAKALSLAAELARLKAEKPALPQVLDSKKVTQVALHKGYTLQQYDWGALVTFGPGVGFNAQQRDESGTFLNVVSYINYKPPVDESGEGTKPVPSKPLPPIEPTPKPNPANETVGTVPRAIAALKAGVKSVTITGPCKMGGQPLEIGDGQTLTIDGEITGQINGPAAMVRLRGDGATLVVNGVLDANESVPRIIEVHADNCRVIGKGTIRNCKHNGVSGDKFKGALIDGITFENCADGGGHPFYCTGPVDGLEIRNCTFKKWRGSIHMLKVRANDKPGTEIRNVNIHHNTIHDASEDGEPISVDDRELDGPPMVFNVRIEHNRYVDKAKGKNIRLRNCVGGVIADNEGVGGFNLDKNKDVEVR